MFFRKKRRRTSRRKKKKIAAQSKGKKKKLPAKKVTVQRKTKRSVTKLKGEDDEFDGLTIDDGLFENGEEMVQSDEEKLKNEHEAKGESCPLVSGTELHSVLLSLKRGESVVVDSLKDFLLSPKYSNVNDTLPRDETTQPISLFHASFHPLFHAEITHCFLIEQCGGEIVLQGKDQGKPLLTRLMEWYTGSSFRAFLKSSVMVKVDMNLLFDVPFSVVVTLWRLLQKKMSRAINFLKWVKKRAELTDESRKRILKACVYSLIKNEAIGNNKGKRMKKSRKLSCEKILTKCAMFVDWFEVLSEEDGISYPVLEVMRWKSCSSIQAFVIKRTVRKNCSCSPKLVSMTRDYVRLFRNDPANVFFVANVGLFPRSVFRHHIYELLGASLDFIIKRPKGLRMSRSWQSTLFSMIHRVGLSCMASTRRSGCFRSNSNNNGSAGTHPAINLMTDCVGFFQLDREYESVWREFMRFLLKNNHHINLVTALYIWGDKLDVFAISYIFRDLMYMMRFAHAGVAELTYFLVPDRTYKKAIKKLLSVVNKIPTNTYNVNEIGALASFTTFLEAVVLSENAHKFKRSRMAIPEHNRNIMKQTEIASFYATFRDFQDEKFASEVAVKHQNLRLDDYLGNRVAYTLRGTMYGFLQKVSKLNLKNAQHPAATQGPRPGQPPLRMNQHSHLVSRRLFDHVVVPSSLRLVSLIRGCKDLKYYGFERRPPVRLGGHSRGARVVRKYVEDAYSLKHCLLCGGFGRCMVIPRKEAYYCSVACFRKDWKNYNEQK